LAETVICPVCQKPVYANTDEHRCEYCHSIYTKLNENVILIELVGTIPRVDFVVLSD